MNYLAPRRKVSLRASSFGGFHSRRLRRDIFATEIKNNLFFCSVIIIFVIFFLIDLIIGDSQLFLIINKKIANPYLDWIVISIFYPLFSLLFIVPLICLFKKEWRRASLIALISGPLSYIIGDFLKILIARPRPFEVLSVNLLGPWHTTSFSFPSTTTALVFGLALPFLIYKNKFAGLLIPISFLVGFSVIYTGFHFPLDVMAGAILSLVLVLSLSIFLTKFNIKK
ncbi:phosphatase PAP2 family protein [Candidatus Parcubacteria bacterium]|nr:phosphatase PAP2 family protein [Candidatus Parcubacteria bacterium]